ncbi:alpha/beta hydrolase [Aggregicoccus sp. 17bor-14]|uniref:alpha/beta fold hydrolase n=1 Tax=Myxococcaceae TaxID=31 RepID=UPI00129C849A|nr:MULTISPECIES: alpha/beta hydrolase [Myxococcaceae]MBF5043581.1 alpha/beta hydrolase [Simulacricoccus sp. 17bor-14]MRI89340.1 alpha/beta hydrolase [Aggregicoccus sp. 17bor-14]
MTIARALSRAGLLALAVLATPGCATSYAKRPPLSFEELPYTSLDGKPWPVKQLALPKTAALHGMVNPPRIAYVELNPQGTRTLLFVHGLGSYLKFWRYQLDAFAAQGYRVVALDLPGYGKSEKPASFPYTMEAMADVVHELAESLGVQKPVLIGHSMGGQTALSYAIRYPDALEALVLTSPAGFEKFSPREKLWFQRVFSTTLVKTTPESAIWGSVRQGNFENWRKELEWLIEERVRLSTTPAFDAYAYAQVRSVDGLVHDDFVRDSLSRIQVPTTILFGGDDKLIPNPFMHGGYARDVMAYGQAGIRGSTMVELAGCGHSVQLDCPEQYNAALRRFLEGLGASR